MKKIQSIQLAYHVNSAQPIDRIIESWEGGRETFLTYFVQLAQNIISVVGFTETDFYRDEDKPMNDCVTRFEGVVHVNGEWSPDNDRKLLYKAFIGMSGNLYVRLCLYHGVFIDSDNVTYTNKVGTSEYEEIDTSSIKFIRGD